MILIIGLTVLVGILVGAFVVAAVIACRIEPMLPL